MTLIFATNNNNKVKEIRNALNERFEIISLKEAGIDKDIPEPYDTLEANASEKSRVIFEMTGKNCFSEDTGLEVEALNGEPGVKSARYADGEPQYVDIVDKLLAKMEGQDNRRARFRTVISVIIDGKESLFEGICEGRIITERRGSNGFGYDPVFIPDGADRTFAEMELDEKKLYSHRAKALKKLIEWLQQSSPS
ncbi:dITP/XTP pyrophosphatase [Mycovorax composti]|uniref:dITP/XTP pyrophosphatase n=1 Tax=Mycovorax composti TaxID=2962693 RepID=A0ABZ2EN65_9BACT